MNNKFFLLVFVALTLVGAAAAYDAAYIVTNPSFFEQGYIDALEEINFTVTIIDDSDVLSTNFSQYQLLIVGNSRFTNPANIPVNRYPTIILNGENIEDWGFTDSSSQLASNQPLKVVNQFYNPEADYITRNLPREPTPTPAYSSCCFGSGLNIPMYYLDRLDILPQLKKVTSTEGHDFDAVVAVRNNGTRMLNGQTATARGCFFGAVHSAYWTPQTEQLFQQCADWVAFGKDADGDGFYGNDCNDADASVYPGAPELNDGIDQNCVADAPVLAPLPGVSFAEDGNTSLNVSSFVTDVDTPLSALSWTVSGQTNVILSVTNGVLRVSATQDWFGSELLNVSVKDAHNLSDIETIAITVNSVNDKPMFVQPIPDVTIEQFSQFSYTAACSDVENDTIAYSDDFAKFDINPTTGVISWIPGENDVGNYTIQVACSDGSLTAFDSFVLSVRVKNTAPTLTIPPQSVQEDASLTLDLAQFAADGQNDPLSFMVTSQSSVNVSCTLVGDDLLIVPALNFAGSASCGVKAFDGFLNSSESSFSITVLPVNDMPTISPLADMVVRAGSKVIVTPNVSDVDSASLSLRANDSRFVTQGNSLVWQTSYNDLGNRTVLITVSDGVLEASTSLKVEIRPVLLLNEFTTDPQTDRDLDQFLTPSDEFIELYNPSNQSVTIVSWKLEMDDSNDAPQFLNGVIGPGAYYTILNPAGVLDNDGQIRLLDNNGLLVDSVSYGSFADGNVSDNAPSGIAAGIADECLARTPDGRDTNVDSDDFRKRECTFGVNNDADVHAPVVSMVAPQGSVVLTNTSLQVSFNASDSVGLASCDLVRDNVSINSVVVSGTNVTHSFVLSDLADHDSFTVQVRCVDTSGNIGSSAIASVTVDINDAPVLLLDPLVLNEDENASLDLTVFASDEDNDSLTFAVLNQSVNVSCVLDGSLLSVIPAAEFSGSGVCAVQVSDPEGLNAVADLAITITPVNDAPVLQAIPDLQGLEDEVVVLDLASYVSDSDSSALTFTTNGFDELQVFINDSVITFTPPQDWSGVASGSVSVADEEFVVDSNTFSVTLEAVNDLPILALPPVSTDEEVAVSLELSDYVSDVEGDLLTFTVLPQNISEMSCVANGSLLEMLPVQDFFGTASCIVEVSDGVEVIEGLLEVTVLPVNDAPVVQVIPDVVTDEDTPAELSLAGLVSDVDGDTLSVTVEGFADAEVFVNDSVIRFVPGENWFGNTSGMLKVSDGVEEVSSNEFVFSVLSVNDAPVLSLDSVSTPEENSTTLDLAHFVSDVENDPITFGVVAQNTSEVSCALDGSLLTVIPSLDFTGSASCTFVASDGVTESLPESLEIIVTPVNDIPGVVQEIPDTEVNEDSSITVDVRPFFADVDGDILTFTASTAAEVEVRVSGGRVTLTPVPDFFGAVEVMVTASDVETSVSDVFTLTVLPVNDAPFFTSTPVTSGSQGIVYEYDVEASDVDGDVLTYSLVKAPAGMSIDADSGMISFVPSQSAVGQSVVTIRVTDPQGASRIQTYVVVISDANDAPVFTQPVGDVSTAEDTSVTVNLADIVDDPDSDVLRFTSSGFENVSITFSGSRMIITPVLNWNGVTEGSITVSDGSESVTSNVFSVTVTPVNDAPVITSAPITNAFELDVYEYQVLAQDPENDTVSFSLIQAPAGMSIDASGMVTFVPTAVQLGQHVVRVKVSDGIAFAIQPYVLMVHDTDQPPVFTSDIPDQEMSEDAVLEVEVGSFVSDPDGDPVRFSVTGFDTMNIIVDDAVITFIPDTNWNGVTSGKIVARASGQEAASNEFSITVLPVNDAPVMDGIDDITVTEGAEVRIVVDATDPEGDAIMYDVDSALFVQDENVFTWQTVDGDAAIYNVIFTASDGVAETSQHVRIVVRDASCTDLDGDGVCDEGDNCPAVPNGEQHDLDGDGLGDACDEDDDGDGVADGEDNCPLVRNADQLNTDNDAFGDACDDDDDNDGYPDSADNCPLVYNPEQYDADRDGIGDACDTDGNLPPVITTTPPSTAEVGKEYAYRLVARDPEGGRLSYSVSDPRFAISGSTFSFMPKENGEVPVTFVVEDDAGNRVSQSVTITVGPKKESQEVHRFSISKAYFYEDRVQPGDTVELYVVVKNRGNRAEENIEVEVSSYDLALFERDGDVEIARHGSDWSAFIFDIPRDAEPGVYAVKIAAENNKHRDVRYITLEVE